MGTSSDGIDDFVWLAIKRLRELRDMTLEDLAHAANIPIMRLSLSEARQTEVNLSLDEFSRIAKALGLESLSSLIVHAETPLEESLLSKL